MHRFRRKENAFSLVEVVMAIGITSFSLLATLGLFANGYSAASEARGRTTAAALATRAFALVSEELKAGRDPSVSLADYREYFDAEALSLGTNARIDQWAYNSRLNFTPVSIGSAGENTRVFRAKVQIQSRRETRTAVQYFAKTAP
jgi:uncharacterized protein (TIGR02598 family)